MLCSTLSKWTSTTSSVDRIKYTPRPEDETYKYTHDLNEGTSNTHLALRMGLAYTYLSQGRDLHIHTPRPKPD